MTENILALKYRPQKFADVIGHPAIVRSLKDVLDSGSNRMFLFSGPSGLGKTTLSRIAAKHVGCRDSDIREHPAAELNGVEDARQLAKSLRFKPVGGGKASAIILDESHRLTKAAFDSLLKAIEEPPPWMWWFLCTTELSAIPRAIQTRCTKYNLKPLGQSELRRWLDTVVQAERLALGQDDDQQESILDLCARHAQGSPREAITHLGACVAAKDVDDARGLLFAVSEEGQGVDLAKALLGTPSWPMVLEILNSLKDEPPEGVRHIVRAYVTSVLLGGKYKQPTKLLAILDEFSKPFSQSEGISSLVLACGKLLHS